MGQWAFLPQSFSRKGNRIQLAMNEIAQASAGHPDCLQDLQDGVLLHFPFGPRGSTVSGRHL